MVSGWLVFIGLVLTALVVRHGRYPLAVLSGDVIGKLCNTEQSNEDSREIEREELHALHQAVTC